ncbi:uncharacterized protein LOC115634075 [Scaptodrosophila lebanonensis]|uniref:Uncharacterized protein LOC115634075 n=1 Tax=Drosophila lebanonensis TaxID=7225 RepID=A0A6J2UGA5_DROLE|nr:uncharacterized protein LOC115634075 [Scaptodrosophila lebanonensis]
MSRNISREKNAERKRQMKQKLTTAKHKLKKKLRGKPHSISFHYQLFLYRQELRRANTDYSYLRLSRAKIMLTSELIAKNVNTGSKLNSLDDLKMLSREVQFKKRLCTQVERLEQFRELGLTDVVLNGKRTAL